MAAVAWSSMLTIRRVAAAALVAASLVDGSLVAQRTWIVDPGGGGQFTDLQTAINAASPGDTLVLRGGSYGTAFVDRSLHLCGDQPRPRVGSLQCMAGTVVSATGMDCSAMTFSSCRVSLEDVNAGEATVTGSTAAFVRCALDCRPTFNATTLLQSGSLVVFEQCQLFGSAGWFNQTLFCTPIPGAPALVVRPGCTVQLGNCTLNGAGPQSVQCINSPGTSGMQVDAGATVRVGHSVVQSGSTGVPAVTGGGTVLYDNTQFVPAFTGGTPSFVPVVDGQGAAPGGVMQAVLLGPPQVPAALVASLGVRVPIAVPEGAAWIDPNAYVVMALGLLDPTGSMPVGLAVPASVQRGLVVAFQGVAVPPGAPGLVASVPALLHVL
jgi:hypothetical protein